LILDWARAERVFIVDVEAGGGDLGEVFENTGIKRKCGCVLWPSHKNIGLGGANLAALGSGTQIYLSEICKELLELGRTLVERN